MMPNKENSDVLYILYLISKIFFECGQLELSLYLMQERVLEPWINFFKTILDMEVPEHLSNAVEDADEIRRRDETIFWKIKAIVAKITHKLFLKYSDPRFYDEDRAIIRNFAKHLSKTFAVPLLESHLQLLFAKKSAFIGSKCLNYAIKFV